MCELDMCVCGSVTSHLHRLARVLWRVFKGSRVESEHHSDRIYSSASLSADTMKKITFTQGLNATRPWRPWIHKTSHRRKTNAYKPYERPSADDQHLKVPVITHPVKLFWPKSRCFDYLYQDAELLLRNYPVQATICLYEDSDSDVDDDSDEEHEKELS